MSGSENWKPGASLHALQQKARVLQSIRAFFAQRDLLEVDTPILSNAAITDPQLESFHTQFAGRDYFLHTSPEFYMKRLLAAGSGDIYQIARAFRVDEVGRYHNPEFSLLEWYRLGLDHQTLMDEMQQLISELFAQFSENQLRFTRLSYRQAFINQLAIDPLQASVEELANCAREQQIEIPTGMVMDDKDMWLDWLMVAAVAPGFDRRGMTFIYDYPASQAALARLSKDDPRVAHRFELFYGDLELANGFYELLDADEQLARFHKENDLRKQRGQNIMPIDMQLIAALKSGLPDCAGVAMGLDRLLMVLTGARSISEVISFTTPDGE